MDIIFSIFGFIVAIAVLVLVHEWGHYIAAKLTGMRADIFALGMGRRLLGWNKKTGFSFGPLPYDHQYDGVTDWRICLFPIGGYVKIPGMIDESFDQEFKDKKPEPYEFRSKNTLQKVFVLSNGVIMNLILAIFIFSATSFFYGRESSDTTKIGYVKPNSIASNIGFMEGDSVVSINKQKVESFEDMMFDLSLKNMDGDINIEIIRNGNSKTLKASGSIIIKELSENAEKKLPPNMILGLDVAYQRIYVGSVLSATPAEKIGLSPGDTILTLNGESLNSYQELTSIIKGSKNSPVDITWKNGNDTLTSSFIPENGMVGISPRAYYFGGIKTESYGFLESIEIGINRFFDFFGIIINSFSQITKGNIELKNAVAGPAKIFKQAGESASQGVESFIFLIAQLSISLALINILPIPALDGGHLLITIIEGIKGSELPTKTKIMIQNLGVLFLLILFILIFYLDIVNWK